MFCSHLFFHSRQSRSGSFFIAICLLLMTVLLATSPFSSAKSRTERSVATEVSSQPTFQSSNPDILLIEVYKSLAANKLQQAQMKADELVAAYPTFQLGHLIRGDLLLMHTRQVNSFGGNSNGNAEKLKDLRDEAIVRLRSIREKPDPDLIPRSILQLRDDQKQVLVVDAKKSRLYLYENIAGKPKLAMDFYISQGKFGINKKKKVTKKLPLACITSPAALLALNCQIFMGREHFPSLSK